MKKAKLILSGIALFALIGGAFAFKASRGAGTVFAPVTTSTMAANGTVYYLTTTLLPNYSTTTTGATSLFYRSATIINGQSVLVIPTTTRAFSVAP